MEPRVPGSLHIRVNKLENPSWYGIHPALFHFLLTKHTAKALTSCFDEATCISPFTIYRKLLLKESDSGDHCLLKGGQSSFVSDNVWAKYRNTLEINIVSMWLRTKQQPAVRLEQNCCESCPMTWSLQMQKTRYCLYMCRIFLKSEDEIAIYLKRGKRNFLGKVKGLFIVVSVKTTFLLSGLKISANQKY